MVLYFDVSNDPSSIEIIINKLQKFTLTSLRATSIRAYQKAMDFCSGVHSLSVIDLIYQ